MPSPLLLTKYKVTSAEQVLRRIALGIDEPEHLADFKKLFYDRDVNLTEPGPTTNKTALHFAIQGFCDYVTQTATKKINTEILILKLTIIGLLLGKKPSQVNNIGKISDIAERMTSLEKKCELLISTSPDFFKCDSQQDIERLIGKQTFSILTARNIFTQMLRMSENIALIEERVSSQIAALPEDSEFSNPIILLENHSDPAVMYFLDSLHTQSSQAQYKILVEYSSCETTKESLEFANDLKDSDNINNLDKLKLLEGHYAQQVVHVDPRFHHKPMGKLLGPSTHYDYLRLMAPFELNFVNITNDLVGKGIALATQEQIILSRGKVILIIGANHGPDVLLHLARSEISCKYKSFYINSGVDIEVMRDLMDVYSPIFQGLPVELKMLELSQNPEERKLQLEQFGKTHLSGTTKNNQARASCSIS